MKFALVDRFSALALLAALLAPALAATVVDWLVRRPGGRPTAPGPRSGETI